MAYGLQIRNAANTLVLDTSTRMSNVITSGTVTFTTDSSKTGVFYYEGVSSPITMTGVAQNNENEYGIWFSPEFELAHSTVLLVRESAGVLRPNDITSGNPAANTFKIKLYSLTGNVQRTFSYYGFRF
jgi:hypothetical protein